MKKTILTIDDDAKLTNLLCEYFGKHGFNVLFANHPDDGIKTLQKNHVDIIILDVMLPDKDGFEVCKEIRSQSTVPIIMLTARGEVMDRIVGLEIGADDYLAKPFEPRELLARIQSILRRRSGSSERKILNYKDLTIDVPKRSATLQEKSIELSTAEFEILILLATHPGDVLSRDQIMDHLKGMECDAFNRSIDVLVSRLRTKLEDDPKQPRFIKTVWGTGYSFIGEVAH